MSELDELNKQIAELEAKKTTILARERDAALEQTKANVKNFGFTAQELGLATKAKRGSKAKKEITFRDSETGNEWDGDLNQKGRKPTWIKDRIANGTIEKHRISK